MTTHIGRDGSVEIATVLVAELRSWTLNRAGNVIPDTVMGDTAETFKGTTTQWDGAAECFYDQEDAGQISLVEGSEVALDMMPRGDTSGFEHYTGQAIVTAVNLQAESAGMVEVSFTFQGTGALTIADIV